MELGKPTKGGAVNLDLGLLQLNISLTISGIETLTDTLQQTLQETGGTLNENLTKLVDAVNELGPENLKNWAESGSNQAKELFNKLYSQLEEVKQRGSEEAGELVEKLGGKMQSAASEEPGTSH